MSQIIEVGEEFEQTEHKSSIKGSDFSDYSTGINISRMREIEEPLMNNLSEFETKP